jgi:hypothetical protein
VNISRQDVNKVFLTLKALLKQQAEIWKMKDKTRKFQMPFGGNLRSLSGYVAAI